LIEDSVSGRLVVHLKLVHNTSMSTMLNRRQLLALAAAAAGAAAVGLPTMADTAPAGEAVAGSAPPAKQPSTTQEGVALVTTAYASVGYPLPDDQVEEVRKQLGGYPGDFVKARNLSLDNAVAPTMIVTAALPQRRK
jgi:hypothetical protein